MLADLFREEKQEGEIVELCDESKGEVTTQWILRSGVAFAEIKTVEEERKNIYTLLDYILLLGIS